MTNLLDSRHARQIIRPRSAQASSVSRAELSFNPSFSAPTHATTAEATNPGQDLILGQDEALAKNDQ